MNYLTTNQIQCWYKVMPHYIQTEYVSWVTKVNMIGSVLSFVAVRKASLQKSQRWIHSSGMLCDEVSNGRPVR